jgi:hypothetical protein
VNTQPEEVKIVSKVSCKNSPKRELLRDLTIATVQGNIDKLLEWLEDDVRWKIIGDEETQGIEEVEVKLKTILERPIQELHIDNIITHGNTGSLNGKLMLKNEGIIDFCHIYLFKGHTKTAKIKEITSYVIETN